MRWLRSSARIPSMPSTRTCYASSRSLKKASLRSSGLVRERPQHPLQVLPGRSLIAFPKPGSLEDRGTVEEPSQDLRATPPVDLLGDVGVFLADPTLEQIKRL